MRGRPDPDYESVANNGAVERAGVHINNEGGYFTTGSEGGYETLPDNVTTSLATPHTGVNIQYILIAFYILFRDIKTKDCDSSLRAFDQNLFSSLKQFSSLFSAVFEES